MANYSFVQLPGNGVTQNFGFPFPYMNKTHISVKVNGTDTVFSWLTSNIIQITPAPANGAIVEIRRTTPITTPVVDFSNGAVLAESDLDLSNIQTLYIAQELEDARSNAILLASDGSYDAFDRRIGNVANPTLPQDSATKNYVDSQFASSGGGHALFSHTDTDPGAAITPGAILLGDGETPSKVSTLPVGGKGSLLVGVPSNSKKLAWVPIGADYSYPIADNGKSEGLRWVPSRTFTSEELEMVGDGVTNNLALMNAGFTALPSTGGRILLEPGTFNFSSGVTVGNKPIIVEGCGKGITVLQITTLASLQHFFNLTRSAIFRNLTLKVQTPSGTDYEMKAVNLDLFAGGSAGQFLISDNVEILGFDLGMYADGGGINPDASLIDFVMHRGLSGNIMTANDLPRGLIHAHRTRLDVVIEDCVLDNDNDGDHAIYAIRNPNVSIRHCILKNTPYHGIKLITNPGDIGELQHWLVDDCYFENNDTAMIAQVTNSMVLPQLTMTNLSSKGSNPRDSSEAAFWIEAADSSQMERVQLSNIKVKDAAKACINFGVGATGKIRHATLTGSTFINWSTSSVGLYSGVSKNGSGAFEAFHSDGNYFDGATKGRQPYNLVANGVAVLHGKTFVNDCTNVVDSHAQTFTE